MTAGIGTLNGAPVGPDLPAAVVCSICGHPVYVAKGVVAAEGDDLVSVDQVMELDWLYAVMSWPGSGQPWPPSPWALTEHVHRDAR